MSGIVLDASVAAAWLLREELDPPALTALDILRSEGVCVPPLWHYEVRNALLVAERRGRVPDGGARRGLETLRDASIDTDEATDLDTALELALAHGLSFYDASYLELARRRGLPLATRDRALARAVRAEGLEVVA
ncbi:MAG: type II toxin-antitoxin system VapC family toxin [Chloroflexi bacterium]|nr:type II toxin-antitoxin system VapC family toxin [Chloroflexota bacterium]